MAALASRTNSSHAPSTKSIRRTKKEKDMTSKKGKAREDTTKSSAGNAPVEGTPASWNGKEVPWEWASITTPAASRVPPIFTRDRSYFFSLVGSSVQIHSVATGQVVSTLIAPRNKTGAKSQSNSFSCAVVNPHNPFQLITGSLDGCLMIWDFLDGSLLRTVDVAQPIHLICAHEQFKDYVFVAASRRSSKGSAYDNNAVVLRVSLQNVEASTNSTSLRSADITPVGKTRFTTGLAISPNGLWLVATAGHKVYVAKTMALSAGFAKYVSPERLTCLAFHPSEGYFATGDDKGVIRLWYCLNDNLINARGVEKKTQTTSMHWHAHAVSALAFTSNGAYLLSGGEEAVLVIWQLETGRKEFVPRIGSPINTVSLSRSKTGEEEYLLGLSDATYVFVNAGSLKVSRSCSRIKIDPSIYTKDSSPSSRFGPTPIAVHGLSSTVILPSSHPSSLQIYSPSTSTLVSELEVSPSNRVSRREDKPVEHSRVEDCVISPSGHWMATVDVREGDDDFRAEVYLKFWSWDEKHKLWALNTRIDSPHADRRISSLSFSPDQSENASLQSVTVGMDGIVKVWRLRGRKMKNGEREEFWVTRTTLGYLSEKPRYAVWSKDASLLAVNYESCIIIYETSTFTVLQTFMSPECTNPWSAYFVGGRNLLVRGGAQLVLWDILTHTVLWHHSTTHKIHSVHPHPSGSSFSVFEEPASSDDSRTTRISIHTLQSPKPIKVHILPFALRCIAWYPNLAQPSHFSFLGINETWSLVAFGDSVDLSQEDTSARKLAADATAPKPTLFQDIFGSSAFVDLTDLPPRTLQQDVLSISTSAKEIFESPAYLTPALNTFFDPLIHTFLKKRVVEEPPPDESSKMDVDEDDDGGEVKSQLVTAAVTRTVTSSELSDLVGLFKKYAIQDRALLHSAGVNGKGANGIRESATSDRQPPSKDLSNGISRKLKTPVITAVSNASSDSSASSPPLMNGRKRKKP